MSDPVWRLFDGTDAMAEAAAGLVTTVGQDCVRRFGRFNLGLSGGRGPIALFRHLRDRGAELPWSKVTLYWADERWVPHEHDDSNFGSACRLWLGPQGLIPRARPVNTALETPALGAESYETLLNEDLGQGPLLDLCLLGMGADGHTASLFPASGALQESERVCEAVVHPETGQARVTLTLAALNRCRRLALLVDATGKEAALDAIRSGGSRLPAALVQGIEGPSQWLVSGWTQGRA